MAMSTMLTLIVLVVVIATFTLSLSAPYHRHFDAPPTMANGYERYVIQADDFGSLWSVADATHVLQAIGSVASKENVIAIVFIHGWHHNAAKTDGNLRNFDATLEQLAAILNTADYQKARVDLTGISGCRVIGVYVGWRGRSLPGILDYLTMWWRKAAAERVGDGDVGEFIERVQRIYLRTNTTRAREVDPKRPFMGLITIGHSFGGQVLFKTVSHALEYELIERAPTLANTIARLSGDSKRAAVCIPIDAFGDINILLNPALEAYQFARIDRLYRQLNYPTSQTPQLVVFSADNDVPRKAFFPIARAITRLFRPGFRNSEQGKLWGKALGEFTQQRTHTLKRLPHATPDSITDSDFASDQATRKLLDWDFTGPTVFEDIELQPLRAEDQRIANSPVAVIYTVDHLIDGHNGIFGSDFRSFLVDYVAYIEVKRLMWRANLV
jgi:hypothetical protein